MLNQSDVSSFQVILPGGKNNGTENTRYGVFLRGSPGLSSQNNCFYWVDTGNPECYRFRLDDKKHKTIRTDITFQALGFRERGGFIAPTDDGVKLTDENFAISAVVGNPILGKTHLAYNDGTVGPDGCYYFGYMNIVDLYSKEGGIYRVNKDLTMEKVLGNLALPNGLAFSRDGKTLYVTEMFANRILAYSFDKKTGTFSGEKELIRVPREKGLPDGLICDREGFLWSAHWQGFRITRYRPDGSIEREIPMPVPTPTCMAFGGPDLSTLLITTARKGLSDQQLKEFPQSGATFIMETEFQGMEERIFAG
jgi:sugar lactone lactonase YvrE